MSKRKGQTSAKIRASARRNGAKGGRPNEIERVVGRSANTRIGHEALSALSRYQKARADLTVEKAKREKARRLVEAKELIPAPAVRAWALRLIGGVRRELDQIVAVAEGLALQDQTSASIVKQAADTVAKRIRSRLAAMPELAPSQKGDGDGGA